MPTEETPADRYALVGHPVEHSRSPLIHQLFARQTGQNMTYDLIDALPEEFETAVLGFAAAGGLGMNVTVPHKEAAFSLCRSHGREAQEAGAVNTITFKNGTPHGDNTDGIGFLRDIGENHEVSIASTRVLILGAGGAARGIVRPILSEDPMSLIIANRTVGRAEDLRDNLDLPSDLSIATFEDLDELGSFDIVINATSAGLKGEAPPFPGSLISKTTFCYDLVYSIKPTPFVTWAKENGADRAVQGWGMLVEQAAESFSIWRGIRPDTGPILEKMMRFSG